MRKMYGVFRIEINVQEDNMVFRKEESSDEEIGVSE